MTLYICSSHGETTINIPLFGSFHRPPDQLVPAPVLGGHAEPQHPLQPGTLRRSHLQCARVLLGDVQVFQTLPTDGPSAAHDAGHPAQPGAGLTGVPEQSDTGRLLQCPDLSSGPGLGGRPHQQPLQVRLHALVSFLHICG